MLTGILLSSLLTLVAANEFIHKLSFGYDEKISHDGRSIPGWHLSGEGHAPQILSDRIVLTAPAIGGTRGSLWSQEPNPETSWIAQVLFRAGGSDRGTGNLQLWYVKEGSSAIGSNSMYTVGRFEGLVLVVDQHGGQGGVLRGFLNDGSTSYRDHSMTDSLAFAQCVFPYRNLGRSSEIQLTHDTRGLEVKIDNHPCFSSDKVSLPAGYHFGIRATTSDNPDSFEVNSFHMIRADNVPGGHHDSTHHNDESGHMSNAPEQIPDADASTFHRQDEQFADLHNRMQGLSHQINNLFMEFDRVIRTVNDRQTEVVSKLGNGDVDRRLSAIESSLRSMQGDLARRDYSNHFNDLHDAVRNVKGGLSGELPDALHEIVKRSSLRWTHLILVAVVVQATLAGVYFAYKRRRKNAPKKYL